MKSAYLILTAVTMAVLLRSAGLPPGGKTGAAPLQAEQVVAVQNNTAAPRSAKRQVPRKVVSDIGRSALPELSLPLFTDDTLLAVRTPLLPPVRTRLLFAGDVMQHMPQVASARRADGTFDYNPCFAYVQPLFEEAGLAIVNLETTLTASDDYTGYPCFRSPLALAGALKAAGVDVCMLANNHCCDGGAQGIRTTLAELDRLGVAHTGVFADSADYRKHHPLRLTSNGIRIALLNYTYGTNGIPVPRGMLVNLIDTAAMARDLLIAQDGTDCVVVFLHWGNEYERQANTSQRKLAAFLRSHGADVVIGSHPHVVQPFETDAGGVVFYSLGNFVSNQRGRYTDGGLMADVRITHRPGRSTLYAAEAIPVWVGLPGYRIIPPGAADTLQMPAQYTRFIADTQGLFYK